MGHKGHYGEYSGNAKWSKVTNSNMGDTKKDDEAHMKYLKEDVDYDNKHGHSDSSMTADEKHISKLAGDLKYDEKKHGSPVDYKKIIRKKKPKEPTVYEGGMSTVEPSKPQRSALHQSVMVKSDGSAYTKEDDEKAHENEIRNFAKTLNVSQESTRKGGAVGGGWIGGGKVLSGAKQIAKLAAKVAAKKGGAKGVDEII